VPTEDAAAGATPPAFPARPVRLVVPFGQEGATDRVARLVAGGLTRRWKRPVLVENRPGASGANGLAAALATPADGHTLLLGTVTNASIAPRFARAAAAIDFGAAFAPVAAIGLAPNVLVVPGTSPARDVAGLVDLARRRPGSVRYASAGAGQTIHLCGELFRTTTGADLGHVPYAQGSATAYDDLLHGRVDLMFDSVVGALDAIRDGRLRALAVVADRRATALPDVPTLAEAGVPGMRAPIWFGLFAIAAAPASILARVREDAAAVLADDAIRAALAALGVEVAADVGAEALRETMEAADAIWRRNLQTTGLTPG
jgi:tripartite-type tricarboxylate transporter receptor subunit TctC